MEQNYVMKAPIAIVLTFVVLAACQLAQAVIEPVVFALFVITITWPLDKALQTRMPKAVALLLTIIITLAAVFALFWIIAWGGHELAEWIRANLDQAQATLLSSTAWLEEHDIFVLSLISDNVNPASMIRFFRVVALRVNTVLAFSVIVLIFVIFGLTETEAFQKKIALGKDQDTTQRLLTAGKQISEKFQKYMLVRTIASIVTGLAVWLFVLLMGLELASAWGVLSFALNYLPYIGPLVVTVLPAFMAFIQTGSTETALFVLFGLLLIQFAIGSYLEPVFSGSALAISPTVVMFAVLLWTFLWGALGAFLGVPLAIATLTICEQFPSTHWIADILSGDSPREASAS
jgi:AI-2 transport protein TqsA